MALVRCTKCGKELSVSFGHCMAQGWPKCCGYTMRLMTKAEALDIDGAVSSIINGGVRTK